MDGVKSNKTNISPSSRPNPDAEKSAVKRPRRQRMHLPFENRKQDAGEWAYDHRLGLSVMVIAYLLMGIVFDEHPAVVINGRAVRHAAAGDVHVPAGINGSLIRHATAGDI